MALFMPGQDPIPKMIDVETSGLVLYE